MSKLFATTLGTTLTTQAATSQIATVTTEHTLVTIATVGIYVLIVDCSVLLANDVLELRAYQMVLTGGTSRVIQAVTYSGAQIADDFIKVSPLLYNDLTDATACKFTLKQTFGTSRTFPWKVLRLGAA